jgi:hypothetical protein
VALLVIALPPWLAALVESAQRPGVGGVVLRRVQARQIDQQE